MSANKKIIFLSVGVILAGLLIIGGTYAFLIFNASVTGGNYSAGTTCFYVDYDVTNDGGTSDITGTLFPSSNPVGGLFGNVTMGINHSCNIAGTGNIYLNVISVDSVLIQTVSAHCEDSKSLKTLTDYTIFSTCTGQSNAVWVTNGTALKYAVYTNVNSEPVKVGYITGTGDIKLYGNFSLSNTQTKYYIYVWLDGEISDNLYASIPFNGYIHVDAVQSE